MINGKLPKTWECLATDEAEKEHVKGVVQTNLVHEEHNQLGLSEAIHVNHFSQEIKSYRVTAYVTRFITNLKSRISKTSDIEEELNTDEIRVAKEMCILDVQKEIENDAKFPSIEEKSRRAKGIWNYGVQ